MLTLQLLGVQAIMRIVDDKAYAAAGVRNLHQQAQIAVAYWLLMIAKILASTPLTHTGIIMDTQAKLVITGPTHEVPQKTLEWVCPRG